ncbi:hypothetical protein SAMD00019534_001730 [Acytostelium subglobosum LB1]|uniref:hypothetical protein n=1 Tax=Acytostelium subglobosum LB1 TaxID=1410327 RepID=UPI000644805B|nr:hypothetical protein SAMD00019534_001730 [Acytostelium subglobosum LB1]GAM16998.1 hypothetical protein SAMD00019534_001730 [Acytostelium subglobosum LB1]|eukprot:XP_012759060.1 hypothetical protein SAMD00019534_001730 [Acytostelium subglobosum LB1]
MTCKQLYSLLKSLLPHIQPSNDKWRHIDKKEVRERTQGGSTLRTTLNDNSKNNQFPQTLTRLILETSNGSINGLPITPGILPQTLLELRMEYEIEITPNLFPESLNTLSLGKYSNAKLEPGLLPESIRRLVIGDNRFKPITPGVLPTRLIQLKICSVDGVTRRMLPNTLKFLTIMDFFTPITSNQLPESLNWLTTDGDIPILSKDSKLQTLNLVDHFCKQHITSGLLPDSIIRLSIPRSSGQPSSKTAWPPRLLHVVLASLNHFRFDGTFPKSLISVGVRDPVRFEGVLPPFITKLDSFHLIVNHKLKKENARPLLLFIKHLFTRVPNVTTYYLRFTDGSLMQLRRLDKRNTLSILQRSTDSSWETILANIPKYLPSDINYECHSLGLSQYTCRYNKANTFVQILTIPEVSCLNPTQ